jgi:hypothetical protein
MEGSFRDVAIVAGNHGAALRGWTLIDKMTARRVVENKTLLF